MLGPRPFLFLPPLPLPFGAPGLARGGVLDLVRLGAGAVGLAAGLSGCDDFIGSGSKWKLTEGWANTLLISSSRGSVPCSSLFKVVILSAM